MELTVSVVLFLHADYDSSSIPTTVTIPGDQNRTCFTGDIIDDTIAAEFTENFFLNIIGVSDPDVTVVLDRTEIAIMDDDCKTCFLIDLSAHVFHSLVPVLCLSPSPS